MQIQHSRRLNTCLKCRPRFNCFSYFYLNFIFNFAKRVIQVLLLNNYNAYISSNIYLVFSYERELKSAITTSILINIIFKIIAI